MRYIKKSVIVKNYYLFAEKEGEPYGNQI